MRWVLPSDSSRQRFLTLFMVRPRLWAKGREIEMPTAKKQALEMVKKLPDKATWDDSMYEIYVRKKIAAGIHASDEGRVVPHETVRKRFIKK